MVLLKLGSELANLVKKFQSVLKVSADCRLNVNPCPESDRKGRPKFFIRIYFGRLLPLTPSPRLLRLCLATKQHFILAHFSLKFLFDFS